jgi:putative ABC transport system permease protein
MDALLQDIRYALRVSARTPGFTIVAVLVLALGIGANTAIFTIVDAVLLERLPFRDPDRIVALWEESSRRPGRNNVLGPSQFIRWRERATAFERMAALVDTRQNLTGGEAPEEVVVQIVTADFFPILGVAPLVGRTFSDEENRDPQANVVVLGYELWKRRFGGDPDIVGRTIQLNARPIMVVGVMPPGFQLFMKAGSVAGRPSDLWAPYVLPANARDFGGRFAEAIALLKPGGSIAAAQAELTAIARALERETPERNANWGARVVALHDELSGEYRRALVILAGAVAFVLLIACANVANLLLARGAARQREIAIRAALGAPRGRVVRQLLTESLVLAVLGGAAGLLVAVWGLAILLTLSPVDLTTTAQIRLSYPVLAFTAAISLLTAVVCGLAPAFEGARTDVQETIKDGARQIGGTVRRTRMRQALVISEIALAVVLLVGAGLMLRSFASLRRVDPGFTTRNILTLRLQLPGAKYGTDEQRIRFFQDVTARVRELPGVQAAGAVSYLPLTGLGAGTRFTIEGQPPPPPGQDHVTNVSVCDNGYFQVLNMPLVSGRLFTGREMRERSNVVIVSESLVRTYFPRENPIGKRLAISMANPIVPTEIIGVVRDIRFQDLTAAPQPTTYWPHPQLAYGTMTLTVRSAADPLPLAAAVEQAIRTLDKDQPVSDVRTMSQWVARSLARARFSSTLLATFAAVALLLAAIGIYGVMSYAVGQRTAEIGIRLALGAGTGDILRMIVGGAMRLAIVGLAIGAVLALGLSRTLTALLYETTATDPVTFIAVIAVLGSAAVLASYLPARRASRIAPIDALRHQ